MTNLAAVLTAFQQKHDVSAKVLAGQIGIGESTLCRIKAGSMPDAAGLAKIIAWLVAARASMRSGKQCE